MIKLIIFHTSDLGDAGDPAYLQSILRQLLFVRLHLLHAEDVEKNIAEKDLLCAWKVGDYRADD